jgi:Cd2+/Zn2+-exporting ATPase
MFRRREDGKVWNFSGHAEAVSHARGLISEATRELMVVVGDDDLNALADDLKSADQRGVRLGVMLTGDVEFTIGEVIRHPKHETELHQLGGAILVVADEQECLVAGPGENALATVTSNANLVLITRQFIWMELFSQRIFSRLGDDLLQRLDEQDRRVLAGS